MTSIRKRLAVVAVAAALLVVPFAALAQGTGGPGPGQVFLYEMSERAVLLGIDLRCVSTGGVVCSTPHPVVLAPSATSPTGLVLAGTSIPGLPTIRSAVAELQGVATLGSPLCPAELVTDGKSKTCTVKATGMDDVDLSVDLLTGAVTATTGTLSGTFDVLVQLDNSVDSPEWTIQTGAFFGAITFGATGIPIGSAEGFFVPGGTIRQAQACGTSSQTWICLPFTAKFRQPFATGADGRTKPVRGQNAFYLLDDGKLQPVRQDERATGWPTVRFEVSF